MIQMQHPHHRPVGRALGALVGTVTCVGFAGTWLNTAAAEEVTWRRRRHYYHSSSGSSLSSTEMWLIFGVVALAVVVAVGLGLYMAHRNRRERANEPVTQTSTGPYQSYQPPAGGGYSAPGQGPNAAPPYSAPGQDGWSGQPGQPQQYNNPPGGPN